MITWYLHNRTQQGISEKLPKVQRYQIAQNEFNISRHNVILWSGIKGYKHGICKWENDKEWLCCAFCITNIDFVQCLSSEGCYIKLIRETKRHTIQYPILSWTEEVHLGSESL